VSLTMEVKEVINAEPLKSQEDVSRDPELGYGHPPGLMTVTKKEDVAEDPRLRAAVDAYVSNEHRICSYTPIERDSLWSSMAAALAAADAVDPVRAELVGALRDAVEMIEFWSGYASDYFKEKHDLDGDIAKVRAAFTKANG
jgi:hypothetical protein